MSDYYWDSCSHKLLYDWIHGKAGIIEGLFGAEDGAGVPGAAGAQDGWGRLAAVMENARERTEAALRRAGVEWEGSAFEAMNSGVTPLAAWAADSSTAGTASQSSVDTHVSAYSAARNAMPEPVPVTSTANSDLGGIPAAFTHLLGGQTDQDRQEAAAQEAKAEAVRIMSGYDLESAVSKDKAGRFVPPPSVTVTVAPTQVATTDIPDSSQPWSGPNGGGDSTRTAGHTPGGTPTGGPTPPHVNPPGTPPPGTTPSGSPPPSTLPHQNQLPPNPHRPGGTPPPSQVPPGHGPITVGRGPGGAPTGRGPGGATTGRGPGAGSPGSGGAGRSPGAGPGSPGGGRGAMPFGSGPAGESAAGRSAPGTGGRGGMGMAPASGRANGDEDKEHNTPEYLRSTNDSFWDDTDPVAPPVIGEDDE
jgi:hypothetical protein